MTGIAAQARGQVKRHIKVNSNQVQDQPGLHSKLPGQPRLHSEILSLKIENKENEAYV